MAIRYISNEVVSLLRTVTGSSFVNDPDISYDFTFIDISETDPTRLSGMPVNMKLEYSPSQQQREEKGVFLKPGKFIRAFFPNHSNDEVSRMAAKLARELTGSHSDLYDQLQVSYTPSRIYNMNHGSSGVISGSCMRNMGDATFELFDCHPKMKILYLVDDDNYLTGRALLHEEVTVEGGHSENEIGKIIKFMDRVYVSNDNYENLFFRWAKEHGYYRKSEQTYSSSYVTNPNGDELGKLDLRIACPGESFDYVPYMDTFSYYCSCDVVLRSSGSYCYEDVLDSTEGGTQDGVLAYSYDYHCANCECGIRSDTDDYYRVGNDIMCEGCFNNDAGTCEYCEEYFWDGDLSSIELVGGNHISVCNDCQDNYSECESCGQWTEDGVQEVKLGVYKKTQEWCSKCVSKAEDDDTELVECEQCGVWYPGTRDQCPACVKADKRRGLAHNMDRMITRFIKRSPHRIQNSDELMMFLDDVPVRFVRNRTYVKRERLFIRDVYMGYRKGYSDQEVWVNAGVFDDSHSYQRLINLLLGTIKKEEVKVVKPEATEEVTLTGTFNASNWEITYQVAA